MKKMLLILMSGLLIACMAGSAMASPFDAAIWNAAGTEPADASLDLKPGQSVTVSFHIANVANGVTTCTYDTPQIIANNGGSISDISITPSPLGSVPLASLSTNVESNGGTGYTDVGKIHISLSSQAPIGATYSVLIGASGQKDGITIDCGGSASRPVTSVPEFPTVALPVAAVIGLVFVFGRKKEGL